MSGKDNDETGGTDEGETEQSTQDPPAQQQPPDQPQEGSPQGQQPQGQPGQAQSIQNQPAQTQPQQGQPRAQPQAQAQPQGTGTGGSAIEDIVENIGDAEVRAAQYGTVAFGILGFGYFVYEFLANLLGSGTSTSGLQATARVFPGAEEELLYFTIAEASSSFVALAPLVAIGLSVYYHRTDRVREQLKTTVISVASGVFVVGLSFLMMAVLFAPDGVELEFGNEIVGLFGVVLGSVAVAGGVSFFLQEDPLNIV